jgi:hypothetical protein
MPAICALRCFGGRVIGGFRAIDAQTRSGGGGRRTNEEQKARLMASPPSSEGHHQDQISAHHQN